MTALLLLLLSCARDPWPTIHPVTSAQESQWSCVVVDALTQQYCGEEDGRFDSARSIHGLTPLADAHYEYSGLRPGLGFLKETLGV